MMQVGPTNFWQWLSESGHRGSELLMILVFVGAVTLVLTVAIISFTVYRVHRNRLHDALKRELLERGTAPDDIVAIVRATPTKRASRDY
jgi:hypothetical protein